MLFPRQNRRKTGELFVNLLALRGLRVARDAETGEDIWYLVGIQSDVTHLVRDSHASHVPIEIKEKHAQELQGVAENLRQELEKERRNRMNMDFSNITVSPLFQ